jgi:transcription termination factor Rho
MTERRRPPRRGRGPRPSARTSADEAGETNPYRDAGDAGDDGPDSTAATTTMPMRPEGEPDVTEPRAPRAPREPREPREPRAPRERAPRTSGETAEVESEEPRERTERAERPERFERGERPERPERPERQERADNRPQGFDRGDRNNQDRNNQDRNDRNDRNDRSGRRNRRSRGRGRPQRGGEPSSPQVSSAPVAVTGEETGWYDTGRDGGYIRRARSSYLAENGDPFIPTHLARQLGLRRGDLLEAAVGRDHRGRTVVVEVRTINGVDIETAAQRPEFNSLPASYPERKLHLETGRPAKGGAELIRRAIDLIAPIGYGQRALIVAPARAGKTTLLHAVTEGVALNHPQAALLILLVDERPEEVSEAISWGVGEVISSSFDQPAQRHVEVTEMVLERARRLVETGRDVVIVLDSLTRMARAHNTAERGTGRTLSGGLDAQAMAKPKAFFGSARAIPATSGGGSLTIIATALVETGSRMDDVIFEEFKGTGNCEIKLDRSLAEKRIYPAIDIATSGTRREEKLFKAEQLDAVYTLRRGLSQMPPQSAMEWLIKRIAATPSNDNLLAGL